MIFPITRLNESFEKKTPIKGIFSVYGDFGVGKTIFSFQTLLNTIELGNDVILIYTKKTFPIFRFSNLINEYASNDLNRILNKLTIIQILNFEELRLLSFNLEFFIIKCQFQNVESPKLIIIDSITDLYRINLIIDKKEKNIELNHQLNQILANLQQLNHKYEIEVLIINDITRSRNENKIYEIQSGGKVMDYWISNSLKISRTCVPNQRRIELTINQQENKISFISNLTERGFE